MPGLRPHPANGFTLVELIIVLLVLSIATAVGMPMLSDSSASQLKAAAQLLAADLDAAKVESLSHADDPRVVVFDTDNATYHIAASSDPDTPITNPFDRKPYSVTFGEGRAASLPMVSIDSVSLDGDDVLGFDIYGQLDQTTDATITLAADGGTLTITVDPATGECTIGQIQ